MSAPPGLRVRVRVGPLALRAMLQACRLCWLALFGRLQAMQTSL